MVLKEHFYYSELRPEFMDSEEEHYILIEFTDDGIDRYRINSTGLTDEKLKHEITKYTKQFGRRPSRLKFVPNGRTYSFDDTFQELDNSITKILVTCYQPDTWRPNTQEWTTAMHLCEALYNENPLDHLKNSELESAALCQISRSRHCMIAFLPNAAPKQLWLVFRGTYSIEDWFRNVKINQRELGEGYVHAGFLERMEDDLDYLMIRNLLEDPLYKDCVVRVTGHSLGAACAQIFFYKALKSDPLIEQKLKEYKSMNSGDPCMASLVFSPPYWASRKVQLDIFTKHWNDYFTSMIDRKDCVPALVNIPEAIESNLEQAQDATSGLTSFVSDLLTNTITSYLKQLSHDFNFRYYAVGSILLVTRTDATKLNVQYEYVISSNEHLQKMLSKGTKINGETVKAHNLKTYKSNLEALGFLQQQRNSSNDCIDHNFISVKVTSVKGSLVITSQGRIEELNVVIMGENFGNLLKELSFIDHMNWSIDKIDEVKLKQKEIRLRHVLKENIVDSSLVNRRLTITTEWGRDDYKISDLCLERTNILSYSEKLTMNLSPALFSTALERYLFLPAGGNLYKKKLQRTLNALDNTIKEYASFIGKDINGSFNSLLSKGKDKSSENLSNVLKESLKYSETICEVLVHPIELVPKDSKISQAARAAGLLVGVSGAIYFAHAYLILQGAASVLSGLAVVVNSDLIQGIVEKAFNLTTVIQQYREILQLLLQNLGEDVPINQEYSIEKKIVQKLIEKEKEKGNNFNLFLASDKGMSASDAITSTSEELFNNPLPDQPVHIKNMRPESQEIAMKLTYLVCEVYRLRLILQEASFVSIMGPHNIGKSSLLQLIMPSTKIIAGHNNDESTDTLQAFEFCKDLFFLDTPGINDKVDTARDISFAGLHASLIIILLHAFAISNDSIDLYLNAKRRAKSGIRIIVFMTRLESISPLNQEKIDEKRSDIQRTLEKACKDNDLTFNANEVELVSLFNNAGAGGTYCKKREKELSDFQVLSRHTVLKRIYSMLLDSELFPSSHSDSGSTFRNKFEKIIQGNAHGDLEKSKQIESTDQMQGTSEDLHSKMIESSLSEAEVQKEIQLYDSQNLAQIIESINEDEFINQKTKDAMEGDADAQYRLGILMQAGYIAEKNEIEAANQFKKASDQGHVKATYRLAMCFKHGSGVELDHDRACALFKTAFSMGDEKSAYNLGLMYEQGQLIDTDHQENEQAAFYFTFASNQGHIAAKVKLGIMYYYEKGVVKDFTKAAELFHEAAKEGCAEAQYNLGIMYETNRGVERNYELAENLFLQAARQDYPKAMHKLGVLYEKGERVDQDYILARSWYKKAADLGYSNSQCSLGLLYFRGQGGQMDKGEAAKLLNLAADQNNERARSFLAKHF